MRYTFFSLFPLPLLGGVRGGLLFPVPCSLFPKTRNSVPHQIKNRYVTIQTAKNC
ncbi:MULTISPECIES: hypothetical protein [unclassified Moorena]|uniref:hypothetical protein n=1 Tax=unclassified Moorena TaxID=2683338 RepID=UPI0013F92C14|nr:MULTISPECIES: hypothetical protein [unclassified Moorena]NEO15643.1 hypothetical protein [Moorena sp. SIO3E8]NEP23177.1 hypothetical protein [Moorena sp. SIO3I6]NEP99420.1 hypothetical protein [Moorena sp. SIO3F7]